MSISVIEGPLWSGKAEFTRAWIATQTTQGKSSVVFRPPKSGRFWTFDVDDDVIEQETFPALLRVSRNIQCVVIEEAHHYSHLVEYVNSYPEKEYLLVGRNIPQAILDKTDNYWHTTGLCARCNKLAPYTIQTNISPNWMNMTPYTYYMNVCSDHKSLGQ